MRKQFNGSFEHNGIDYDYSAVIHTGDDAYTYPDQITDLDRADGEAIDDDIREDIEFEAMLNAFLVEWCEKEGWQEEDTGGGCSSLIKYDGRNNSTRITKENDPGAPQTMDEPVAIGRYDQNDQLIGDVLMFKGGIHEWQEKRAG